MNPELWGRLRSIVEEALDGHGDPHRVVENRCEGDPELCIAALALLNQPTVSTMEPLCPGAAAAMVSGLDASELVGRRFGPYRAIGLIGEGAMGSVFLAVRADDAFERQVAVKVLKVRMGDADSRSRFEQERRILARLDHPGICRLLDAGTTDDGLAYIVMERVEGVSLAEWRRRELDGHDAAASRLQRRRAVQLFARICDAVSCAHREGIVHRDLKPANILVSRTEARNEPNPRVIDFGIARVADSNLTLRVTLETRLLGTLPYMAPEQVAGDRRLIDARADVYALGVILYELLTGRAPLDLEHTALPEAIRIIQNEEPTRLGLLDRSLRGDLETIVAKAMEKVPDRRYASAVEIHADVVRWLSDQTIVARPPSRADRITKFTRRHRVLVAGSSAVFLSLSVAVIAVSISLIRSERQSGRVRAVNEFMHSLLASADPFGPPNRPVVRRPNGADGILASDMLDAAVERLASHPVNDPIVEADIRHSLGVSYSGLGKTEQAISQLRRALALNTAQLGKNAASTLECTIDLATALARSDAFDEAEQLHRGALAQSWELLGPHHSLTLRARLELASCLLHEHRFEDARAETSRVISDAGTADEPVAALASGLRAISLLLSDHAEGDSEARAALQAIDRTCGPDHYVAALIKCSLGGWAEGRGDLAEAERCYRAACASYTRLLGTSDYRTAARLRSFGSVLNREGKFAEAEEPLRRAIAARGNSVADEISSLARHDLAVCLHGQGRHNEADAIENGVTSSHRSGE